MKNLQKGSVAIIIVIITVVIIGGGLYFYSQKTVKPETQEATNADIKKTDSVQPITSLQNTSVNNEAMSTYTNTKFGFKFNYPSTWKMTGEIGKSAASYRPPYLFDEILATENSPLNRAGHVSVLSLSLDKFLEETQKPNSAVTVKDLSDLKTVDLQGKKFKLVHQQVPGSSTQQTDYVYALSLGDKTLYINFLTMNTAEKQISKELEVKIDDFVKTISTI